MKLESVVGSDHISDRPHILAAYRHWSPQSPVKPPSPAAIILPGNTEEVQRIVKICNRYQIKYSAQTSLFGMVMPEQGSVIINMRRMNEILEVNEKGRITGFADCEPAYRKKLLAMGLIKRTELTVVRKAPLGDPIEIQIKDYNLSLRRDEAKAVLVERIV